MIRAVTVALLALVSATDAFADYDAAQEARDKAERDAAQRAEQQKQQAIQAKKQEAEAKYNAAIMQDKRKRLGAAANGKSDAEVERLYDAKLKTDAEAAKKATAAARNTMSQPQNEAAMKSVTGKSMKDLEKMSDAELEALSKDLEKKYGAK